MENKQETTREVLPAHIDKLIELIKSKVIIEEVLFSIRPKLKEAYLDRITLFKSQNNKLYEELKERGYIVLLPVSKMNEEERLLHSFFSISNIKEDLFSLINYLSAMYDSLNAPYDKEIIDKVLECGIAKYYASKVSLYAEDVSDDEEDTKMKTKENDRPMTEEEIQKEIADIQSYPLFMTQIPENPESNEQLQALQALKYEGEPDKVSMEFLEKSKESLKQYQSNKKFKDLKESMYTMCNAIEHVENDEKCDHVKFTLYYSRSQLQIIVKNWGYAIQDLLQALKYDSHSSKDQLEKAIEDIIQCYIQLKELNKATNILNEYKMKINSSLYTSLSEKIDLMKQKLIDDLDKIETFKSMEHSEQIKLYEALTSKGIKLKKQFHNIPAGYETRIVKDSNNKYHFPILIIYEEFNMTDYIQDFEEDRMIGDILDIIFEDGKLVWDTNNKYSQSNCLCYFMSSDINKVTNLESTSYFLIRNDESLIDVLTNKQVFMNGFPVVSIVSSMTNYYPHFLKTKTILKRRNINK